MVRAVASTTPPSGSSTVQPAGSWATSRTLLAGVSTRASRARFNTAPGSIRWRPPGGASEVRTRVPRTGSGERLGDGSAFGSGEGDGSGVGVGVGSGDGDTEGSGADDGPGASVGDSDGVGVGSRTGVGVGSGAGVAASDGASVGSMAPTVGTTGVNARAAATSTRKAPKRGPARRW